ncbi:MAG: calcium-binding protein, partial [Alphaproteobacteria bacterium]
MPTSVTKWGNAFVIDPTGKAPAIGALPNGALVTVSGQNDGGKFDRIEGRFVAADGTVDSTTFQVNGIRKVWHQGADLAVAADGTFIVAYTEGYHGWNLRARVFAPDGSALSSDTALNHPGSAWGPSAVALGNGRFAVIGTDYSEGEPVPPGGDSTGWGVVGWEFSHRGRVAQDMFPVNTTTASNQHEADAAVLSNGGYVAVWRDESTASSGTNTSWAAQHFASGGTPTGGEIRLAPTAGTNRYQPQVTALAGGEYAVAWREGVVSGGVTSYSWQLQIRDQDGTAVNAPVALPSSNTASRLDMLTLNDGRIFVVLFDPHATASLRGMVLNADGSPSSGVFDISPTNDLPDQQPEIAQMADGRVAVVWNTQSGQIVGQFMDPRLAAVTLTGTDGTDSYVGTTMADTFHLGGGNDKAWGGAGLDRLFGEAGKDRLFGEEGDDQMVGGGAGDALFGGAGDDTMRGGAGNDRLSAGDGNDSLEGGGGADRLSGGAGNDTLTGGAGRDTLIGGAGSDRLVGGGGVDRFVFLDVADSTPLAPDQLVLNRGERIDLARIDADESRGGNQAFDWIGKHGFTGQAGELHWRKAGGVARVEGDVDGDGLADFAVMVDADGRL